MDEYEFETHNLSVLEEDIDITKAMFYLDGNMVLCAKVDRRLHFFKKKGDNIYVISSTLKVNLSRDEFKRLYRDTLFYLVNEEENSYDPKKDEEYYSWVERNDLGL